MQPDVAQFNLSGLLPDLTVSKSAKSGFVPTQVKSAVLRLACLLAAAATCMAGLPALSQSTAQAHSVQGGASANPPATPLKITLVRITLNGAIRRAKAINPAYRLARTTAEVAAETSKQERDLNLPSVNYNTQYLYTQGNGTPVGRFIANNAVHEYIAQGNAHETISAAQIAQYRSSTAAAALARDQAEMAARGLVVTVVSSYATLAAAQEKLQTLTQAEAAARTFLETTQELEQGGEVAKADVIKAEIQLDDSRVALENAQALEQEDETALALLVFSDLNQPFELAENPGETLALPSLAQAEAMAQNHNPAIQAAKDARRSTRDSVTAARFGYLPTLTLDYFYGIDATHFATWSPDPSGRIRNLGYSAWAQLNLPIWNWGETHSRVKQAEALNQQAAVELSFANRKLASDLKRLYQDAKSAKEEIQIRRSAASRAVESRSLTLLQYKAGQATALEVVNAEDTVSLERNALADAETRYAVAIANLSTLTGSL